MFTPFEIYTLLRAFRGRFTVAFVGDVCVLGEFGDARVYALKRDADERIDAYIRRMEKFIRAENSFALPIDAQTKSCGSRAPQAETAIKARG